MMTSNYARFLARHGIKVIQPVQCLRCYSQRGSISKRYGKVKRFDKRQRCGFIVTENDQEVFFHQDQLYSDREMTPREGQDVWFHIRYATKGPEALNVELDYE
jgi:cold shock CspA family protein